MPFKEPRWWYDHQSSPLVPLLRPLGAGAGWIAKRRWRTTRPYASKLPVICVGNFTAGGTGKTPLALEVARLLTLAGLKPVFLSRGFGGNINGPHQVIRGTNTASEVGDEVLLLATCAPAFVARQRADGARFIEAAIATGACVGTVIIMDDGLQNPALAKDLTIAVIDGARGMGNGAIIPAGPLRAQLGFQLGLTDAVVINRPPGSTSLHPVIGQLRPQFQGPILHATPAPAGDQTWLTNRPLVAFAGIGNPTRFYDLLRQLKGRVVETLSFADHQPLSQNDATRILGLAASHGAAIVTTEKDLARLQGATGALGTLRDQSRPLPIRLSWANEDEQRLTALLLEALARKSASARRSVV